MAKTSVFEDDMLDLLFKNVNAFGVSAQQASDALKSLGTALGSAHTRDITLTRPKGKNRPFTSRIEAKDIHGGHVSIDAHGNRSFEVTIDYTDRFILNPFQVGDHVIMSGAGKTLHLRITDRKIQQDIALLYLEEGSHMPPNAPPETEEESLDIGHELNQ